MNSANTPPNKRPKKLWGGRFSDQPTDFVESFTESVSFDKRLYHYDIIGSIAHVKMLMRTHIIQPEDGGQILAGLAAVDAEIEAGEFNWQIALEDVHMNLEAALIEKIGEVGKKLHTGRSRNDQVATDLRLYVRAEIDTIDALMLSLMHALLDLAEEHVDTLMPGFTHLQVAQPVTFGHHLMAWFSMLRRDKERLADCRKRVNQLPLGSAALAGTNFPIDRQYVADLLGFDGLCENSMDAVSDRDFAIEFCADAAMIMMHLSRFSEEIILWMSQPFQLVTLSDAWCTGSSIMPQKKNPDLPELVRGKSARVYGDLMAMLTLMKAQPLSYNRDNQEDKEALFDAIDTVKSSLTAYIGLIQALQVHVERMRELASLGHPAATDMADALVKKGVPFRDAHAIVGRAVQKAERTGQSLQELPLSEWQHFSSLIDAQMLQCLVLDNVLAARSHIGGTAPDTVRLAIQTARLHLTN